MISSAASGQRVRGLDAFASCSLLLTSVWCVLLVGRVIEQATEDAIWTTVSFAAAAALVVAFLPGGRPRPDPASVPLCFVAGFSSYPGWFAFVFLVGSALGMPVTSPVSEPASVTLWLAAVLFAPLFEEVLYREHVLSLTRTRAGPVAAVLVSSLFFSVSHVHAWSVLNTFMAGLMLGGVRIASGSIAPCIALHAGFNTATLVCGLPPQRLALAPVWSAVVSWGLLPLAVWTARAAARRRAP